MKAIILDDEKEIRELYVRYLERLGFSVTGFDNPTEVNGVDFSTIDLLLSDIQMPHQSGVDFVSQLFEKKTTPKQILFISAGMSGDMQNRLDVLLKEENVSFMSKPFMSQDLKDRINLLFQA